MRLKNKLLPQDLDYFILLYENLSYSRAAKAVPMSYQGFKKAMRLLEKNLDVTLFKENPQGGLVPTPYAETLYAMAKRWAADVSQLELDFEDIHTHVKTYRLVAVNGTLNHLGSDLVDDFHAQHPSFVLDISEYSDKLVDEMLVSGSCRTAVTAAPFNEELCHYDLFASPLCFWVNTAHPLSQRETIKLADLEGMSLSLPDDHYKYSSSFVRLLEREGVTPKKISYSNNILAPYAYALENKGLGLSVRAADSMFGSRPDVCSIPLENMTYKLAFSHLRGYTPTADDLLVLEFLRSRGQRRLG